MNQMKSVTTLKQLLGSLPHRLRLILIGCVGIGSISTIIDLMILRYAALIIQPSADRQLDLKYCSILLILFALASPFLKIISQKANIKLSSAAGRIWIKKISIGLFLSPFLEIKDYKESEITNLLTIKSDQAVFFFQNQLSSVNALINVSALFVYTLASNPFLTFPFGLLSLVFWGSNRLSRPKILANSTKFLQLNRDVIAMSNTLYLGNKEIRLGDLSQSVSDEISKTFFIAKQVWCNNQLLLQQPKIIIDALIYFIMGLFVLVSVAIIPSDSSDFEKLTDTIVLGFVFIIKCASPLQQLYVSAGLLNTYKSSFLEVINKVNEYSTVKPSPPPSKQIRHPSTLFPIQIMSSNIDTVISVNVHDIVGIKGPSGCGKSTLMDNILGLYNSNGISVKFNGFSTNPLGDNINYNRLRVGFCPQDTFIFQKDLMYNLLLSESPLPSRIQLANQLIEKLEIGHLSNRIISIRSVSGGEKQRIAIARELCKRPSFLFLDECTSALDSNLREKVMHLIKETSNQRCATFIIDHNSSMYSICDKMVIFPGTKK